jgi:hypothetical protein
MANRWRFVVVVAVVVGGKLKGYGDSDVTNNMSAVCR